MPDFGSEILKTLADLNLPPAREAEIIEELSSHLEDRYRELQTSGVPEDEAFRVALEDLRDRARLTSELRSIEPAARFDASVPITTKGVGGFIRRSIEEASTDIRYGVRQLVQSPSFRVVAVLTLAAAVGAATAIFSQVNAVFFKMLPVRNPEELRTLAWTSPKRAFTGTAFGPLWDARLAAGETIGSFSYPGYLRMRDGTTSFSDLACWQDPGENRPVVMPEWGRVEAQIVSGNYFRTLGANAVFTVPEEIAAIALQNKRTVYGILFHATARRCGILKYRNNRRAD